MGKLLPPYILAGEGEGDVITENAGGGTFLVSVLQLLPRKICGDHRSTVFVDPRIDYVVETGYGKFVRYLRTQIINYQKIAIGKPLRGSVPCLTVSESLTLKSSEKFICGYVNDVESFADHGEGNSR